MEASDDLDAITVVDNHIHCMKTVLSLFEARPEDASAIVQGIFEVSAFRRSLKSELRGVLVKCLFDNCLASLPAETKKSKYSEIVRHSQIAFPAVVDSVESSLSRVSTIVKADSVLKTSSAVVMSQARAAVLDLCIKKEKGMMDGLRNSIEVNVDSEHDFVILVLSSIQRCLALLPGAPLEVLYPPSWHSVFARFAPIGAGARASPPPSQPSPSPTPDRSTPPPRDSSPARAPSPPIAFQAFGSSFREVPAASPAPVPSPRRSSPPRYTPPPSVSPMRSQPSVSPHPSTAPGEQRAQSGTEATGTPNRPDADAPPRRDVPKPSIPPFKPLPAFTAQTAPLFSEPLGGEESSTYADSESVPSQTDLDDPLNVKLRAQRQAEKESRKKEVEEILKRQRERLAEMDRKQKEETEKRKAGVVPDLSLHRGTTLPAEDPATMAEKEKFVVSLLADKPYIDRPSLKGMTLAQLQARFEVSGADPDSHEAEDRKEEMKWIVDNVKPKLTKMREQKTDIELRFDARFYNKYVDFLRQRISTRDFYARLGLEPDASTSQIKKAYHKMVLEWHPDHVNRVHRYYFAHYNAYMTLANEIFRLIDDAYRTLIDDQTRALYDRQIGVSAGRRPAAPAAAAPTGDGARAAARPPAGRTRMPFAAF